MRHKIFHQKMEPRTIQSRYFNYILWKCLGHVFHFPKRSNRSASHQEPKLDTQIRNNNATPRLPSAGIHFDCCCCCCCCCWIRGESPDSAGRPRPVNEAADAAKGGRRRGTRKEMRRPTKRPRSRNEEGRASTVVNKTRACHLPSVGRPRKSKRRAPTTGSTYSTSHFQRNVIRRPVFLVFPELLPTFQFPEIRTWFQSSSHPGGLVLLFSYLDSVTIKQLHCFD